MRPAMRFVSIKTPEQQDIQTLHRLREQRLRDRTALFNQVIPTQLSIGTSTTGILAFIVTFAATEPMKISPIGLRPREPITIMSTGMFLAAARMHFGASPSFALTLASTFFTLYSGLSAANLSRYCFSSAARFSQPVAFISSSFSGDIYSAKGWTGTGAVTDKACSSAPKCPQWRSR